MLFAYEFQLSSNLSLHLQAHDVDFDDGVLGGSGQLQVKIWSILYRFSADPAMARAVLRPEKKMLGTGWGQG